MVHNKYKYKVKEDGGEKEVNTNQKIRR
jgi:hypothetical protein